MIYNNVLGDTLSLLGFGTMRLPLTNTDNPKEIDIETTRNMIKTAMESGVNYFDTAWPYHGGMSESVIGEILSSYPRSSYYLADKYPGHQITPETAPYYHPQTIFEKQLKKCRVDYFDYYLLHNVYENDIAVYENESNGIIPFFLEQKKNGRIRHLGFSSHGGVEMLKAFLDRHGKDMEFCQIQVNYLDWEMQNAKEKCELLASYNIPVFVMEPLRGGKLATLSQKDTALLKAKRPDDSVASWAFRYLWGIDNVKMILSGMSNPEQMKDNLSTFCDGKPLDNGEVSLLKQIAQGLYQNIPCTGCRYCTEGCPIGLDIPLLLTIANELRFSENLMTSMRLDALPAEKLPGACIGCGACEHICPQKIPVPALLAELNKTLSRMPKWEEVCQARAKF